MNEIEEFLNKENLNKDLNKILNQIIFYLNKFKIEHKIKLDLFKDYFDKDWKILKIIVKCKDVQNYSYFYLWNELEKILKENLEENKRSKMAVILKI